MGCTGSSPTKDDSPKGQHQQRRRPSAEAKQQRMRKNSVVPAPAPAAGQAQQKQGAPPQQFKSAGAGRTLGGAEKDGDLKDKVAQAAMERQKATPAGISSGTAATLKEKHERDELIGRINELARQAGEDVPLALRSRETPIAKLRSYKKHLQDKLGARRDPQ